MIKKYKDGERYKHQGKSYTWHDGADNLIPDDDPESTYKKHERSNELRRDTPPYKSYSEKLKDPRWQKKRLEMLESSGFRCESCGDTEEELHVHHVYYKKDAMPWDYTDDAYMVLCTKCHNKWHNLKTALDHMFCKMGTDQLHEVVGIVTLLKMMGPGITHTFYELISGFHIIQMKKTEDEPGF